MREVEAKFAVHGSFVLPEGWWTQAGLSDAEELPQQDLRATYYDTDDLRLARSGLTVRYRKGERAGDGWDVKLPERDDVAFARVELRFEGTPTRVPEAIGRLVGAHTRGEKLRAVATLRTRRSEWALKDKDGAQVAVLDDDEVSVVEGNRVVARFRELEVEATGSSAVLPSISEALKSVGAVRSEDIPKVVRALGPGATALPEWHVAALQDGASGRDLIARSISDGCDRIIRHDPFARLGYEEGVHQMRVGTRRLRSDLRLLTPLLDKGWAEKTSSNLRWLGGVLGKVRDCDVLLNGLRASSPALGEDVAPILAAIASRRESARSALLRALRTSRYLALLDDLVRGAADPPLASRVVRPALDVARPLLRNSWSQLDKAGRAIKSSSPDADLHRVRILAKRMRYAAELVAPLRPEAADLARRSADLQTILGDHQDACVAMDEISAFLENGTDHSFAFAAGRLFERQSRVKTDMRAMFPKAWRRLQRKRLRRWLEISPPT